MRRWFIILLVVLAIGIFWLSTGVAGVFGAQTDVAAKFDEIVRFYVAMDAQYVEPLLDNPDLAQGDRDALAAIGSDLKKLNAARGVDAQFSLLLPLQKSVIVFLGGPNFPESFRTDPRFLDWSKNSTKLGGASAVIKAYNEALSLYNARSETPAGKVASWWLSWNYHQFMTIDGTLEESPRISF